MNGVDELEVPTEKFMTGLALFDLARDPEVHLALANDNKRLIQIQCYSRYQKRLQMTQGIRHRLGSCMYRLHLVQVKN